jgi:hypothetical protein
MRTKFMMVLLAATLAACGGGDSKPAKGGGAKGSAAKTAGQMTGPKAAQSTSMSTDQGSTYEDVGCDTSDDGLAWCDDDENIAFCSGGEWYLLDCSALGAYCGDDGSTVDCYDN